MAPARSRIVKKTQAGTRDRSGSARGATCTRGTEHMAMLTRRVFGLLAAGAALGRSVSARAQAFPERPVRMLIGFPPGGTVDTVGRVIAPPISERLGQPLVIENRSGAAGVLAVEAVAHGQPDGYTI